VDMVADCEGSRGLSNPDRSPHGFTCDGLGLPCQDRNCETGNPQ
jgi:hypothetical protein